MKIALIDDDSNVRDLYRNLISAKYKEFEQIVEAGSVVEGVELIKINSPDVVILDIDLGDGTGFDVLQAVKPYNFSLIFSTAFNDYAIKAFKFSALDYVLKPVDESDLCNAIEKALDARENLNLDLRLKNFFNQYSNKSSQQKKIVLKTMGEIHIVDISDIIYCQSDNSYTTFFFSNGDEIVVSRSMKEFEDILTEYSFFRPHNSYLVNLNFIKKLDKSDGGFLILKNGREIPVSVRKKAGLIQVLENL
jgi:two-component system LytT family response regulator